VQEPPKPIVQEPPKPIVQEPPKPIVQEPPKPIVHEPPKPIVQDPPRLMAVEPEPPKPIEETRMFAMVLWRPGKDPRGLVACFPMVIDSFATRHKNQVVPMLLASFRKVYLMRELVEKAKAGLQATAGAAGAVLASDLGGEDPAAVYASAIKLYTKESFLYGRVNTLMRDPERTKEGGTASERSPDAGLWPYISILQIALLRMPKEWNTMLYRGGLISRADLDDAEQKRIVMLFGFTSFSRNEAIARKFMVRALKKQLDGLTPVLFQVWMGDAPKEKVLGTLEVGAGAYIKGGSEFRFEEEVVLLDGTKLNVRVFDRDSMHEGVRHVTISAEVDASATLDYFRIFDNDSR
jgi:hypothetical protein